MIKKTRIASVFIAASLDGFIARENGDLDWLDQANAAVPEGEECGFSSFLSSVDVLIMGRKTFEKVLSFGQWGYGDTKVIVLSTGKVEIPPNLAETVTFSAESPKALCKRLQDEGAKRLYIDGGMTIQSFLKDDLINDITITTIPMLLGSGIPLFGKVANDIKLKHLETRVFEFGFIQSRYEVENVG